MARSQTPEAAWRYAKEFGRTCMHCHSATKAWSKPRMKVCDGCELKKTARASVK